MILLKRISEKLIFKDHFFAVDLLLFISLIFRSLVLIYLNFYFPIEGYSDNTDRYLMIRIFWKNIGSGVCSISTLLYMVYYVVKFIKNVMHKITISISYIWVFCGIQIVLMLICTIPFAYIDTYICGNARFFYDYIFYLWVPGYTVIVLAVVSTIYNVIVMVRN